METIQQQEPAQVRLERVYPVAPEKVWRAWTDPQAVKQWFGSGKPDSVLAAEFDLRVGGRFRIAFTGPDGGTNEASGVYQEVVPHRRLMFSWAWKSTPDRVSRITIDLAPKADGTELRFVHDRFFDAKAASNHQRGWTVMFEQLDGYIQRDSPGA